MKKGCIIKKFLLIIFCFSMISAIYATIDQKDIVLDAKSREAIVNSLMVALQKNYILADKAQTMKELLQSQLQNGAYNNINSPQAFSDKLTSDLRSINNDKHLSITFNPKDAKKIGNSKSQVMSPQDKKRMTVFLNQSNYGFNAVEILPGNIGYIDFSMFAPAEFSKNTIASVMGFVSNSNAIIFDLRDNHGGSPTAIQLICSYLFSEKPVHLNDQYFRDTNKTQAFWTLKNIEGKRMPNIPVYILTSHATFSAAEEFTYDLKNLKRATVVGETTGGGAHMVKPIVIDDGFIANIPYAQAINPITKTNWEGTGVVPNVTIPAEDALTKAQLLALADIAKMTQDKEVKRQSLWILNTLQGLSKAPTLDSEQLQRFVGTYGEGNHVTYKNGKLFYQKDNIADINQIVPLSDNTFVYINMNFPPLTQVRLHFDINTQQEVQGITEQYIDGHDEYYKKSN